MVTELELILLELSRLLEFLFGIKKHILKTE